MDLLLLAVRLVLAAVFTLAGVAKLVDRGGSRRAVEEFGVPKQLSRVVAVALPATELGLAVALIVNPLAWWGALGSMALLAVFVAVIIVSLAQGRHPNCQCFGRLGTAPVGIATLARNLALAAGAGFILWQGRTDAGASATGWLQRLSTSDIATLVVIVVVTAAIAFLGLLGFNLLRQQGRLLLRIEELEKAVHPSGATRIEAERQQTLAPVTGLPVGSPAPEFEVPDLEGQGLSLADFRSRGKPVMLLFIDPHCGPCSTLLPEVGRWQREYSSELSVILVSTGTSKANAAKAGPHGISDILLQEHSEVAEAYRYAGTPSAVIVSASGRIASPLVSGAEAVESLVQQHVGRYQLPLLPYPPGPANRDKADAKHLGRDPGQPPRVGEPAPSLALPSSTGGTVDLGSPRGGRKSLLLFWNPACGFCQQLLPDLLAWEQQKSDQAANLVVVSTGGTEENPTLASHSTLVLDPQGKAMAAFGAHGTPMAVLVDAEGKVASELAVGKDAVLDLAMDSANSSFPLDRMSDARGQ